MERPVLEREGMVRMVELKELAKKHLKAGSTLRNLICSEPDYIPAEEGPVKAKIFAKLLSQEIRPEPR